MSKTRNLVLMSVVIFIVAIVVSQSNIINRYVIPIQNSGIKNNNSTILASQGSSPFTTIFKQVENSVVQITSRVPSSLDAQIIVNGNPQESQPARLGSGFVYDKQG